MSVRDLFRKRPFYKTCSVPKLLNVVHIEIIILFFKVFVLFLYLYSEALLSMQLPKVLPLLMRFTTPYIYNVLTQGQLCGEANARRFTDQTKMPKHVCFSVCLKKLSKVVVFIGQCHISLPIPLKMVSDWSDMPNLSPQIAVRAGLGSINGSNRPHHVSLHGKLQKCKILQPLPVQQNPVYGP